MMERIKEMLSRGNLLYKAVALILAILLWLAVTKPFSI